MTVAEPTQPLFVSAGFACRHEMQRASGRVPDGACIVCQPAMFPNPPSRFLAWFTAYRAYIAARDDDLGPSCCEVTLGRHGFCPEPALPETGKCARHSGRELIHG